MTIQRKFGFRYAMVLALLFVLPAFLWFYWQWAHFLKTPLISADKSLIYIFESGSSISRLAQDFNQLGLLKEPNYLIRLAYWRGQTARLQAGKYQFPAGATPEQVLDQLVAGRVLAYHFTIIEGWTFSKLINALHDNPDLLHDIDNRSAKEIMQYLGVAQEDPEGRFFPSTYVFHYPATELSILRRAYQLMQRSLAKEWANRRVEPSPLKTPYEALIAASMVEKETALASELSQVAGVILRRLQLRMHLQIDASVIYGLGERYRGRLARSQLKIDTPYNTYKHYGLPPTPIAFPSLAALHAVLHPDRGSALYYVARGDGGHTFSKTLKEHNMAVQQYRKQKLKKSQLQVREVLAVQAGQ